MRLDIEQHGCGLSIALLISIFLLMIGPVDWWRRYQSWSNLSKYKLVETANKYVATRAPGNDACIYAVECKGGRASLKLIKSIEEWEFEESKQIAWDRKFKGVCQGRSANFALEVATDNPQSQETSEGARRAVWSFNNDRFVPTWSRTAGFSAFSETETEPCLTTYAVTRRSKIKL